MSWIKSAQNAVMFLIVYLGPVFFKDILHRKIVQGTLKSFKQTSKQESLFSRCFTEEFSMFKPIG